MATLKIFSNPEKDDIHRTKNDEINLRFSKPFKILIIGRSGVGKTNLLKYIIQCNDGFDIVYLMHANIESKEYNDIPHIKYELEEDYVERFMANDTDRLLIIDDIDFNNMSKKIQNYMYKMITYIGARGVSIIASSQDPVYYPPSIRRAFEILIIYPFYNEDSLRTISKYTSPILSLDEIVFVFNKLVKTKYDFIIVNKTNEKAFVCINNKIKLLKVIN
jgi:predicted AAA+ superfamily ATPase